MLIAILKPALIEMFFEKFDKFFFSFVFEMMYAYRISTDFFISFHSIFTFYSNLVFFIIQYPWSNTQLK